MDLALSTVTGDLLLSNGDLATVDGADGITQFLSQRLKFFLTEWFLDETLGMPYFDTILVKNPDEALVSSVFKKEILNTPGVDSLIQFTLDFDVPSRTLTVSLLAKTTAGEIISYNDTLGV